MISFRYHIVSIVAVFLALAAGIVIGTTALNGPVTGDLRNQVKSLKSDRSSLTTQSKSLQKQVADANQFVSTMGADLVKGRLQNQKVLVVDLPGATSAVQTSVATALTSAGAALTGQLQLAPDYGDQSSASSLTAFLTNGVQPAGFNFPTGTSDARVLGAALLAYVLVKGQPTDLTTALTGFAGLHMINSDPKQVQPATNVVVVGTGTQAPGAYAGQAELDLVTQLQTAGAHVVVAGDGGSATAGGIVGLVRSNAIRSAVSTVDDTDAVFGPPSVVLATQSALNSQVGQYGTAAGAEALLPAPSS